MLSWRLLFVLGVALTAIPCASNAQDFSIDAASPEVGPGPPVIIESDIFPWNTGPPTVLITGMSLGLIAGEELDAVSYGNDQLAPASTANWVFLTYSVDRAAVGAGGQVSAEVGGNGAAGDQFSIIVNGFGTVSAGPFLAMDATFNALTPGPGPGESDLDAHSIPVGTTDSVYYSIDAAAVATASARWGMPLLSPSDILYVAAPPVGGPAVYATSAALGLQATDDIDALAIEEKGTPGVLDPGDLVYISLTPASPTLLANGWSPGDVIQIYPGPPVVIFPAATLDLLATDNLNALTAHDPGPQTPATTNWSLLALTVLLLVLATTFILWGRRLFRSPI